MNNKKYNSDRALYRRKFGGKAEFKQLMILGFLTILLSNILTAGLYGTYVTQLSEEEKYLAQGKAIQSMLEKQYDGLITLKILMLTNP